jgi:type VI secretion system protein ImpL
MKTFLRILMWIFVALLVSAIVLSVNYLLEQPLETGLIALAVIFGLYFSFILLRKLFIRLRAKAQVRGLLNIGQDDEVDDELGMSSAELSRSLKQGWNTTIKALKNSQLKYQGDPLYALPWYMVFGRPTSGKSTSLRNSKLLLPSIDLSEHKDGSTLNLEWWLYEEGIVIDTAGRYAVPDRMERDRKEWNSLLGMIAKHRQKEPLNGLVLAVAADRLLGCSDDEILEEGRQIRNSINHLMDKLEVKVPVYLMVTKSDLIPGFKEWATYLPEELKTQAMGYLNEATTSDVDTVVDTALDNVLDRLKEVRLLMMEQTENPDASLLTLPRSMESIRSGLHVFIKTALKGNAYQEAPHFRGLYFSSSLQEKDGENVRNGLFLHDFFTKILPADRGSLISLPSALRIKSAARKYALGISGAVTFSSIVGLTALYNTDKAVLEDIYTNYGDTAISVDKEQSPSDVLVSAYRLKNLIDSMAAYKEQEYLPWTTLLGQANQVDTLRDQFLEFVRLNLIKPYDSKLKKSIDQLEQGQTSALAGGLVRRINVIQSRLSPDSDIPIMPIGSEYLLVQNNTIDAEESELFNEVYSAYVGWSHSLVDLSDEKKTLQAALLYLVKHNHGDYNWIVQWANSQDFDGYRLKDFWGGSYKVVNPPTIDAAYTLEGYAFIQEFLTEFKLANSEDKQLSEIQEDFDKYYERQYVEAWISFAQRFDEGKMQQRDKKEWQQLLERFATSDNPYFSLLGTMNEQLSVFEGASFNSKEQLTFFADVQSYSVADGRKGKPNTRLIKKALGKFGKVGKMAKKAMKIHKKATKGKKGGEELDSALEDAVVAVDAYKQALAEIAFKSDSRTQSLSSVTELFQTPDALESGNGSMATAWMSIKELQALIGKPVSTSKVFWHLFVGPMYAIYDYMENESSCEIQDRWQNDVLATLDGVSSNQVGNLVVGEGGVLWNFLDTEIAPFIEKKYKRGIVRANIEQRSINLSEELLEVLNQAESGKFIVGNSFDVAVNALPTGANPGARIQPYATFVDLYCSDGTQTLANYNYPTQHTFKWALETCGDTTLRIEIGQLTLMKNYPGVKGFSKFLQEFQDGRHIFSSTDFPNQQAQLENSGVSFIDINFEIRGQRPVIQMLDSVPLQLPEVAAHCW